MQIEYAALDALCLLMLLDNMISCAPPQLSTQASAHAIEAEASNATKQSHSPQGSDLPHQQSQYSKQQQQPLPQHTDPSIAAQTDSQVATGTTAGIDLNAAADRSLYTGNNRQPAASNARISSNQRSSSAPPDSNAEQPSSSLQQDPQEPSEHQLAIQQAAEHWACRLEMAAEGRANKPRAKRNMSRRQRAHNRHSVEQQNQIDQAVGESVSK